MTLTESDVDPDPIVQFRAWHAEAGAPAEVAVATAGAGGAPSVRMVLLKSVDARGFVFFTNAGSTKARDLAANPQAALLFFFAPDRQVRVEGPVEGATEEESDAYWRSRPRGSQLGAWASRQSEVIEDRAVLERRPRPPSASPARCPGRRSGAASGCCLRPSSSGITATTACTTASATAGRAPAGSSSASPPERAPVLGAETLRF